MKLMKTATENGGLDALSRPAAPAGCTDTHPDLATEPVRGRQLEGTQRSGQDAANTAAVLRRLRLKRERAPLKVHCTLSAMIGLARVTMLWAASCKPPTSRRAMLRNEPTKVVMFGDTRRVFSMLGSTRVETFSITLPIVSSLES